ncbi:hypothetical protein H0H87_007939 [Tephrocybe sp. NHM501043]|nr:hypothetical protein H0H87_007939 [Tephrocybe sp. NHM501043]
MRADAEAREYHPQRSFIERVQKKVHRFQDGENKQSPDLTDVKLYKHNEAVVSNEVKYGDVELLSESHRVQQDSLNVKYRGAKMV